MRNRAYRGRTGKLSGFQSGLISQIKMKELPATRTRSQFRFKKDLVDRWLEEMIANN